MFSMLVLIPWIDFPIYYLSHHPQWNAICHLLKIRKSAPRKVKYLIWGRSHVVGSKAGGHDQVQVSPLPFLPFYAGKFHHSTHSPPPRLMLRQSDANSNGCATVNSGRISAKRDKEYWPDSYGFLWQVCVFLSEWNFVMVNKLKRAERDCRPQRFETEVWPHASVVWGSGSWREARRIHTLFMWVLLSMGEAEWSEFKQQNPQISLHFVNSWDAQRQSWTDRFLVF